MRATWTIARRELKALFDQPTAYILLVVFTGVNGFLTFRQVDLYGSASLRPMFDFLPWVLLFLVPAVTMRALAEDARSGTLEVVLAQPITELELLLGKYVGQVLFLWLALAITLTIPLGLALGTGPQVGILIAQYVGAALLILGLAGVGVWASSVTRNQITAFILAVTVMFALMLVGLDPLVVGLPPQLGAIAASLGVLSHFSSIARGVIDLRDAVYFVSLAVLFLVFAYYALLARKVTPQGEAVKRLRLGTALLAVAVIVVNLFGRHIGGRIDLTPGNSFTLSAATRQLLGTLPDLVTVKLFASAALPPEVAFLKRDVDDLLDDYRAAGRGKLKLVIADPAADSAAMREARTLGIPPVQFNVLGQAELQVKEGYLGLAVRYADGVKTMPFLQQTNDLEYRLTSDIRALTHPEKTVIAFGEIGDAASARSQRSFEALRERLGSHYDVRPFGVADTTIAPGVRVIVERPAQTVRRLDRLRHGVRPGVERAGGYPGAVRPGARALSVLAAGAQHESLARECRPRGRAAAVGEPDRHRAHFLHRGDAAVRHEPRRRRAGDDGVPRPDADVQPRQSATAGGGAAREPAPTRYREGSAARPRGGGGSRGFRERSLRAQLPREHRVRRERDRLAGTGRCADRHPIQEPRPTAARVHEPHPSPRGQVRQHLRRAGAPDRGRCAPAVAAPSDDAPDL